ncbi:MAG: hypothetical protein HWN68_19720 [Desulfobacterales bacterium]|nr:hypothetical protein [Desulfobacterales bacterium]
MKVHVQFIEWANPLRRIADIELDLTTGSGLPVKGDVVWLYDKARERQKQFWVVERHWNIGSIIGMIQVYVLPTSEGARAI